MRDSRPKRFEGTPGEADWDAIFREHEPRVRRFLWGKVPSALLDDVVQDTFVRAYRSRGRLDPTSSPVPWLLTIARRARCEALRVMPPAAVSDVDGLAAVAGPADPHEDFERRLRRRAMAMALADLSPRHRRLFIEWELKGDIEFTRLAAEEGLTPQALKSVLSRARTAFRTRYTTAAERTGAAAAVAWSRLLRRNRVPRTTGWSTAGLPLMEAAMGGMAALVTATVLFHANAGVDTERTVSTESISAQFAAESPIDLPTFPSPGTAASPGARAQDAPPADPPSRPARAVAAAATVDIGVDERRSNATMTVEVEHPVGPLDVSGTIEVRCDSMLRAAVCNATRWTPLAK